MMPISLRARLSTMMFIQYFIWSVWWVPFGAFLSKNGFDAIIGKVYATQGYGAILAPLFIGMVADRLFSAQKVMGALHLCGALMLFLTAQLDSSSSPTMYIFGALGAWACYMPTLPLATTIAFNAVDDTARDFPSIRVFGTLGWIAAGLAIGFAHLEQTNVPVLIAAIVSAAHGLYCFTLPETPPRASGGRPSLARLLGLDALAGGGRTFALFIFFALVTTIPLSFYYAYTNAFLVEAGVPRAAAVQTLGQVSEALFMLAMPFLFLRMGIKWVMVIGMASWALRYVCFAFGLTAAGPVIPLLVLGILLHGMCYDFFFVAGQIYVDRTFPPETRGRAQSFLALVTLGVGTALGSLIANAIYTAHTSATGHDWKGIWLQPGAMALISAIIFAIIFRERIVAGTKPMVEPAVVG